MPDNPGTNCEISRANSLREKKMRRLRGLAGNDASSIGPICACCYNDVAARRQDCGVHVIAGGASGSTEITTPNS
jgi:hypothetical protein